MHRSLRAVTAAALVSSLLALMSASTLGASPQPFPDLTMAPLVTQPPTPTMPPIVAPAARDATIPVDGYTLGAETAPVTVEVFEDFQCPYCGGFTAQIEPQLVDAYVRPGLARLVFRDLPFLGEESRWASVAARLAEQQGRFWPMHDYLFANQLGENVGSFTPDRLMAMAQAAGLDMDAFIAGLQVPAARALYAQIESEAYQAASSMGVSATPSVFVNGVKLAAIDFASVSAAIDAALASPVPGSASPATAQPSSPSPFPSGSAAP